MLWNWSFLGSWSLIFHQVLWKFWDFEQCRFAGFWVVTISFNFVAVTATFSIPSKIFCHDSIKLTFLESSVASSSGSQKFLGNGWQKIPEIYEIDGTSQNSQEIDGIVTRKSWKSQTLIEYLSKFPPKATTTARTITKTVQRARSIASSVECWPKAVRKICVCGVCLCVCVCACLWCVCVCVCVCVRARLGLGDRTAGETP